MKSVNIYTYQVGLVFRKGNYIKALAEGRYWLRFSDSVKVYNMLEPFEAPCELNILLQDQALAEMLNVWEVKDHEIALLYKDGNFSKVYLAGKYAFWNSIVEYDMRVYDMNQLEIPVEVDRSILQNRQLIHWVRTYIVQSYEEGILMVDGKYIRKLEAGVHHFWKTDQSVSIMKVDLRQQHLEINGQEILTKDKANLRINFDAQYKVVDTLKALIETGNYLKQLYGYMQFAIRAYVGTLTLDELLAKKAEIAPFILEEVKDRAVGLGVEVLGCGIRDIILPGEVKEIMNQVLIAEKRAQANIITRREETASTRSLLNTAKLMENNEMLFKLKEMEYVEKIADKINSISLSGGGQLVEQLRQIFGSK